MPKYMIKFEYYVPEWTDIELEAMDKDEAEDMARREFDILYPEAIDANILEISEIN